MRMSNRLSRLETSNAPSKAGRWRADMERRKHEIGEAMRKLASVIEQKLAERGINPDHLPPQTPEQRAEAKRTLLQALRARLIE